MNKIAALLTVHNRREKTLKCLNALENCSLSENYSLDVYLVDDGCNDGTSEAVAEQFPQINIVQGTGNLYWNRGMYLAWTIAVKSKDYEFYLWLNDDTVIYPDAIRELVETSESENHRSIICGATCATDNPQKITYGGRNSIKTVITPSGQKQKCRYMNGNILLVPKFVYLKLGTNDPYFLHSLGDYDYGLRARKLGIDVIIAPKVLGMCDEHERFAAWCNPDTHVIKRFKLLYTPLGNHPIQFFVYERRHFGLIISCFHFFTIHFRALFPNFWKNTKTRG